MQIKILTYYYVLTTNGQVKSAKMHHCLTSKVGIINNAEILNLKQSENRMHFLSACLALTGPVFVKAGCQAFAALYFSFYFRLLKNNNLICILFKAFLSCCSFEHIYILFQFKLLFCDKDVKQIIGKELPKENCIKICV